MFIPSIYTEDKPITEIQLPLETKYKTKVIIKIRVIIIKLAIIKINGAAFTNEFILLKSNLFILFEKDPYKSGD